MRQLLLDREAMHDARCDKAINALFELIARPKRCVEVDEDDVVGKQSADRHVERNLGGNSEANRSRGLSQS